MWQFRVQKAKARTEVVVTTPVILRVVEMSRLRGGMFDSVAVKREGDVYLYVYVNERQKKEEHKAPHLQSRRGRDSQRNKRPLPNHAADVRKDI